MTPFQRLVQNIFKDTDELWSKENGDDKIFVAYEVEKLSESMYKIKQYKGYPGFEKGTLIYDPYVSYSSNDELDQDLQRLCDEYAEQGYTCFASR